MYLNNNEVLLIQFNKQTMPSSNNRRCQTNTDEGKQINKFSDQWFP